MDSVACVVVGAGVVGLAAARALALAGWETIILEGGDGIGGGISSRNSEVIHAGLHYPPGSLKARLCVTGRDQLYAFCESHGIAHRRCGKLNVAVTDAEIDMLDAIRRNAAASGVTDLVWLDRAEARALEPELDIRCALLSPSTGIVDSHGLMLALLADAEAAGAVLALRSRVERLALDEDGVIVWLAGDDRPALRTRQLVNAAALFAVDLARRIDGFPAAWIPDYRFAKGNYFALGRRSPFSRLVYPAPEPGGLGTHLTLDLAGNARFGPDVEWLETTDPAKLDYRVDPARSAKFYRAVRRYWPALVDGDLVPAYAGIRPKLTGPSEPAADFRIDGPEAHGVPSVINLFGIESPGLTASLALGDHVAALAEKSR